MWVFLYYFRNDGLEISAGVLGIFLCLSLQEEKVDGCAELGHLGANSLPHVSRWCSGVWRRVEVV